MSQAEVQQVNDEWVPVRTLNVEKRLGCCRTAVYTVLLKSIPVLRVGRAIRVRPADVEKFIREHTSAPGQAQAAA
jgi:hypothetical protein